MTKPKSKPKTKPNFPKSFFLVPFLNLVSYLLFIVTLLLITIFISYQLAYRHRIYPGIQIGNINVGNKTTTEAKALLTSHLESFQKTGLSFSFDGEIKNTALSTLDINYDLDQAIQEAYRIGRHPNLFLSLNQKVNAWTGHFNLSPHYSFDNQKFATLLADFNNKIAQPPVEAKISIQNSQIIISPPQSGEGLDLFAAKTDFQNSLRTLSKSPILLQKKILHPLLESSEVENLRVQLSSLLQTPIKLNFGTKNWEIGPADLAEMISFSGTSSNPILTMVLGGQNFQINSLKLDQPVQLNGREITLDQTKLKEFVSKIAQEIDQEPIDAKFNFSGGKVLQFASHRDGQKLDRADTISQVNQAFLDHQQKGQGSEIALKVAVTKAAITTESVNNLGINELIGVGVSKFAGSIPNRQANVGLAASRVNGTLIAPGETFSMYKTIGEVDASTGYKEAYIISKGRTQLDFGGGVCQVSTTLFRAALNSGLPIIERHPHAYRVGYYEQNSPVGIDASVFFPYSDFRFKNDTDHHILIQTKFNAASATLTFEFYGTKDSRSVTMSKPLLSNITPAPPELHQDDPTLPAGTVKQVDFAASGATASFNWTVTKNGAVLHQETFYSKYAPWQAVFLHGTKVG